MRDSEGAEARFEIECNEMVRHSQTGRIQDAMSLLLSALGFGTMAREVKNETDLARLRRYARLIVNQSPNGKRLELANLFRMHKPSLY